MGIIYKKAGILVLALRKGDIGLSVRTFCVVIKKSTADERSAVLFDLKILSKHIKR